MPNPADAIRRAHGASLFQPDAYRAAYLGNSAWYRRPFVHYFAIGARRGQRPNPFFDPVYYRAQLAAAGVRPRSSLLNFYLRHGADRAELPSEEFDHSWYAAVNRDCLGGNHPLEHYLRRGLAEGRDPAPHIDLRRWMASHGTTSADAPALMLRQIAATGRLEGEGADYGFVSLEASQTAFRANSDWRTLRRADAPQRPNLVFVQTAPGAVHRFAVPERSFDLMLNYYEEPGAEPHAACEYAIFQRGSKVTAIEAILRRDPTLLRSYERVIFLDDDIDLGASDLDRFFAVMQSHDLLLAQPLLTPDSDCAWPIFRDVAHTGHVVPTDGVEVMMPAFSRAALDRLAWTFSEGISGFGIDLLWGQTWPEAQQAGRIAIIGEVSARHLRPIDEAAGPFYRFMFRHGIDPKRELWRIMQRHGVQLGFTPLPVFPCPPKPITCIAAAAPTEATRPLRLAAAVMVRNEADILPRFLAHCAALFDHIVVMEHRSSDGSREILEAAQAAGVPIDVLDCGVRGYFQAAITNLLVRRAFAAGADWVFPLDADEFIDITDRPALEAVLNAQVRGACKFVWRNVAPVRQGSWSHFDVAGEYLCRAMPSVWSKVVLSQAVADRHPGFWLHLGNHEISPQPGMTPLELPIVGEYLHIPIRSRDRLEAKLESGVAAYRALGRAKPEGGHWRELREQLLAGSLDDAALRDAILNYGETHSGAAGGDRHPPLPRRIAPPMADLQLDIPLPDVSTVRRRERAVAWRFLEIEKDEAVLAMIQNDEIILTPRVQQADGAPGPDRFEALPTDAPPPKPGPETLTSAVEAAFAPIETVVPSAWSRHAPLLFSLFHILRPRRFVELGSHFGFSFFAACQAGRQSGAQTECVAIDTWRGDHQAGIYNDEVLEQFRELLRIRHVGPHYLIRARFEEAVACFEDGSIDLLHIDGLHTYEAVQADFTTWRPKLSRRGVILFHDTTVYDGDFGVWRLWERLARSHPAVNLLHCHGLGILYVGDEENGLSDLMSRFAPESEGANLLNCLYRGVGALAVAVASNAAASASSLAAQDVLQREKAAIQQENAVLQQERSVLQQENAALRASTSWRITAPLRATVSWLRRR